MGDSIGSDQKSRIIECKLLEKLGMILGGCVEKFLDLSLVRLHSLLSKSSSIVSHLSVNEIQHSQKEFASVLLSTLDHTQIGKMGIGCVDINENSNEDKSSSF